MRAQIVNVSFSYSGKVFLYLVIKHTCLPTLASLLLKHYAGNKDFLKVIEPNGHIQSKRTPSLFCKLELPSVIH